MQQKVTFHFHAYQPGDIIRRKDTSPFEPFSFEERRSPVSLFIDEKEVAGANWTDAALGCYAHMKRIFSKLENEEKAPPISIDIEPFTLLSLLKKDKAEGTAAWRGLMDVFEKKLADPVLTLPFHPIMPHLPVFEQRLFSEIAFDFASPMLKSCKGEEHLDEGEPSVVGIWLPEACYSEEAANTLASVYYSRIGQERGGASDPRKMLFLKRMFLLKKLFLILDGRQFVKPSMQHFLWSANFLSLGAHRMFVFGRDQALSDSFAFNIEDTKNLVEQICKKREDGAKEEAHVPYMVTLASDLEALISDPKRSAEFVKLMNAIERSGVKCVCHSEFLKRKITGEYNSWKGEGESADFEAIIKDFSSWSDYFDGGSGGRTSDSRWTGLRRSDGRILSREAGGRSISQIWKQGYRHLLDIVRTTVRRNALEIISSETGDAEENTEEAAKILAAYNRVVFREHYIELGVQKDETDFKKFISENFESASKPDILAECCRAYYEMLMGHRSCPTFWENIDTRVTFQNAALLSQSLIDIIHIYDAKGMRAQSDEVFNTFRVEMLDFKNCFKRCALATMYGQVGWESSKSAWDAATQSEIPDITPYDVVKRAALFTSIGSLPGRYLKDIQFDRGKAVADTGHIQGELHGNWANKKWCENKGHA